MRKHKVSIVLSTGDAVAVLGQKAQLRARKILDIYYWISVQYENRCSKIQ